MPRAAGPQHLRQPQYAVTSIDIVFAVINGRSAVAACIGGGTSRINSFLLARAGTCTDGAKVASGAVDSPRLAGKTSAAVPPPGCVAGAGRTRPSGAAAAAAKLSSNDHRQQAASLGAIGRFVSVDVAIMYPA